MSLHFASRRCICKLPPLGSLKSRTVKIHALATAPTLATTTLALAAAALALALAATAVAASAVAAATVPVRT